MTIGYNPFDEDFSLEEFCEYRTMALSLREEKLQLLKRIDKLEKDKREILQYVGDLYDDGDQRFRLKDYQWHKNLCKKYGVEVDE